VNQGGEPGHDDYGLPRVDIEIPDDARELDRDVQAYHRELRALRRQQRSLRWRAPFQRSGFAIPLLAGCLVVALLGVMASAMFSANPDFTQQQPGQSAGANHPSAGRSTQPATASTSLTSPAQLFPTPGAPLPRKSLNVAGKLVSLTSLRIAALAIVPINCDCGLALGQLLAQADKANVVVYLVGPRGTSLATLDRLAATAAKAVKVGKPARVATDPANVLTAAYQPTGLTVLLVDSRGGVSVAARLGSGLMLEKALQLLHPTG
jgi:hypothetical protein